MEMRRKQLIKYRVPAIVLLVAIAYPLSLPLAVSLTRHTVVPRQALLGYVPLLVAWEQLFPHYQKPDALKQVEFVDIVESDDGERLL